ncbi:glycoside hydrolase family 5 protein [Paucibacter sp. APW11]|uniref:Glycoside hydrolase family 5 protein n=1 Tax=Roseateles aquae TaxID=3077235 RepID=A0ABU3PB47_9BURK|nr:glycoside hydrolase family 5 protein [Paucibacter sp. APW11]MDT8999517.1 glycoside hydrolase family 5 protein [Paucibacter sp. APW11]
MSLALRCLTAAALALGSWLPDSATAAPPAASPSTVASASALGRGVNFGNMLDAPREGAWGLSLSDEFIAKAWAAGFRSVRLPVRWSNHAAATAPYAIEPAFMARVSSAVDALLAQGFTVVLNMHHYRQLDGDALDEGDLAVPEAEVDARFLQLWAQIAPRFAHHGPRLLLELYNEPHGRLNGEPWNRLAEQALAIVRRSHPTRPVIIGPTHWNNASDLPLLKLPPDRNLIVTVHNYAPFNFTHQGAAWIQPPLPLGLHCCDQAQRAELDAPLAAAQAWAAARGLPVYLGEFGAIGLADEASRVAFTRAMRDAAEARGMSWAYWEMAADFGVYDPKAKAFRARLLDALMGPR